MKKTYYHAVTMDKLPSIMRSGLIKNVSENGIYFTDDAVSSLDWIRCREELWFKKNHKSMKFITKAIVENNVIQRPIFHLDEVDKLKDDVMLKENDNEFKSWASVEDVKLVKERARLKRCIDAKLISVINKISNGDSSGGFNPEVKKYG